MDWDEDRHEAWIANLSFPAVIFWDRFPIVKRLGYFPRSSILKDLGGYLQKNYYATYTITTNFFHFEIPQLDINYIELNYGK